jgi:hypothetical protein
MYDPLNDPMASPAYWKDKPRNTTWEQERAGRHVALKLCDTMDCQIDLLKKEIAVLRKSVSINQPDADTLIKL